MKREVIELPAKDPVEKQNGHRKLRVAAYCRVSTSLEAQQNSYEAQLLHPPRNIEKKTHSHP